LVESLWIRPKNMVLIDISTYVLRNLIKNHKQCFVLNKYTA
jgi:hypothetical protein